MKRFRLTDWDNRLMIALLLIPILTASGKPYEYLIIPPVTFHVYREEEKAPPLPPRREVPAEYRDIFAAASEDYEIPPGVLESIAWIESGFRSGALSLPRANGRDRGMFQFNDRYLQWYADQYNCGKAFDPMLPTEAIIIAAQHIHWLYNRYGHWPDVVIAYNAGFHAVDTGAIPDKAWDYLIKVYSE
jgi:soluble lytic murein transglycosylase-like protein